MFQKILLVTPSAYTLGGLATWLNYLLPGLREQGYQVILGLVDGVRYHLPERYLAVHPDPSWVKIPCRTGTPEGRKNALLECFRQVKPDLVMSVNIPDCYSAMHAYKQESHSNVKVIMACHGIQHDLFGDLAMYQHTLDGVVCTNKLACELSVVVGGIDRSRVYYAPVGTKLSESAASQPDNQVCELLYVGRLEKDQKRVYDLLPLLSILKESSIEYRLNIVGNGPEKEFLQQQIIAQNFGEIVQFHGTLGIGEIVNKIFPRMNALIMPSWWETGPLVIWEAMAAGVPVISSKYVGSGKEQALIDGENCLLYPLGDMKAAAQQIQRVFTAHELARKLTVNALDMIKARYSIQVSIAKWKQALIEISSQPTLMKDCDSIVPRQSGRLDRWLGPQLGERIRKYIPSKFSPTDPGDEWPHTHSALDNNHQEFWKLAQQLDSA